MDIQFTDGGGNYMTSFNPTTSWTRYSVTHSYGATPSSPQAAIYFDYSTSGAANSDEFLIWGAQLEDVTGLSNTGPGVYVKTTTSTVTASRGIVSGGDILMPSLKLSGGSITDTTGTVTVGATNNLI